MKKEEAKVTLRNIVMDYQKETGKKTLLKTYPYVYYLGALTYAHTSEEVDQIQLQIRQTLKSPSQSF